LRQVGLSETSMGSAAEVISIFGRYQHEAVTAAAERQSICAC
jgi:hypothetical protein